MIPKWQIAGLVVLLLIAIGAAIHASPNSYAYVFFTGQCNQPRPPVACHPARTRGLRFPRGGPSSAP